MRTKWKLKCKAKRLRRKDRKLEEPSPASKTPAVKETAQSKPFGINGSKGTSIASRIQVGAKRKRTSRPNENASNATVAKKFKTDSTEVVAQKPGLATELQKLKRSNLQLSEDTHLAPKVCEIPLWFGSLLD